jgi:hypothetical protein
MKDRRDLDFQRFYDGEGPAPATGAPGRDELATEFALVSERLSHLAYRAGRDYAGRSASTLERAAPRPRRFARAAWGLAAAAAVSACSAYVLQRLMETIEAVSFFVFVLF